MGCCNKKNYLHDKINDLMKDFYFRLIRQDFVISKVQEFNKSKRNYHSFWVLTKLLGIHTDMNLQTDYWESAFVKYSELSLDGLLLLFLLLCQGDTQSKLEYIKYYMSSNINFSKENDNTLIMNYYEFRKILCVYFSCLTIIPLNTFLKINKINDETSESMILRYNEHTIRNFTEFVIKDYVKKNFYVNAGKFLEQNIKFLLDDNLVRKTIYNFNSGHNSNGDGTGKVTKKPSMQSNNEESEGNIKELNIVEINTEAKPLKSKNSKRKSRVSCCSSKELMKKNKKNNIK